MAKVKLNSPFAEISGAVGDFVFRKCKKEGEAILAKRPRKPKKPSKAQQAQWVASQQPQPMPRWHWPTLSYVLIMKPRPEN